MSRHKHTWKRDVEVVGGCDENPGCFQTDGRFRFVSNCRRCGAIKTETHPHPGDRYEPVVSVVRTAAGREYRREIYGV